MKVVGNNIFHGFFLAWFHRTYCNGVGNAHTNKYCGIPVRLNIEYRGFQVGCQSQILFTRACVLSAIGGGIANGF